MNSEIEEERGIVLTQDAAVPELPECRPALEWSEGVVRSVDERLRAGQLDEVSAIALLRSAIGGDEGDRLLYDRACELLLQSGEAREAARLAEKGLARFDGDLALMSRLGYAYAAEGETKRALEQWARVRQTHPSAEAGWIEGAMCGASLGFENEAGELLGAYLAQLEDRLSRYWWDRVLSVAQVILPGYSENQHVRVLLEALFLRPVAPDLSAHFGLIRPLIFCNFPNYHQSRSLTKKVVDLLEDIYWNSSLERDDDHAIFLELALGITVERKSPGRVREFLEKLSYMDFCKVFKLRCMPFVQSDFLFERDNVQEEIAALPVTDPDNAKKCLAMRYGLGMDYSAAYEALTGLPLPTAREGYSDFAFAAYAGNGRPKVAFCISGQLRGYRDAFASWRKSRLFADCDVSIFVHTWPEVGALILTPDRERRVFSGDFLHAFHKEYGLVEGSREQRTKKLEKVYPNLFRTVAESRVVSAAEAAELAGFYETPYVVVEPEEPYRDYTASEKMYYKIQACWELACASEEKFHFAFRVRPDLALRDDSKVDWREVVELSQNERIAYVQYLRFHAAGLAISDQLGFGNPAVMAVYSNTWTRAKDPNGLIRMYLDSLIGHIPIALNLVEHAVRSTPFPEGFFVDELLETRRPSLESLRGALEKDLTPDKRHENLLWRALEKDISHEIKQVRRSG